ncbi:MAG: hypothetical protein GDA51_04750 [Ekhidna sp.]|nr:hypothetical protein [Ekhidna sp.]
MTSVKVKDKFMYLSLITDAYSRRIMGWLHESLSVEGPVKALMRALGNQRSSQGISYLSQ